MALSKLEALQILFTTYVPFAALLYWGVPDPILNFYLAHPWDLFFGTFTLPMLTLIYTTPGSRIRLAVALMTAVAFCCYHATSLQFMPDRPNATYYDGRHIVLFLTTVDVLLLRRLYLDRFGKERSQVLDRDMGVKDDATWIEDYRTGSDVSTWRALKWAAHVFFSERDIGTGREAKNILSFPGGQAPSRAKFLLYRGCAVIGAVVFLVSWFLESSTAAFSRCICTPQVQASTFQTRYNNGECNCENIQYLGVMDRAACCPRPTVQSGKLCWSGNALDSSP